MQASEDADAADVVEDGPDVILIDNLLVQASVGVHDFERGRPQGLRFDIEIETVANYRDIVRETGTYVSYEDAVAFIEANARSGEHVELVEAWAESVAAFILQNPLAAAVTVAVTKPDIFDAAGGVGIRIRRRAT